MEHANDNSGPSPGEKLLLKFLTTSAAIESHVETGLPRMLAEIGLRPSAIETVIEHLRPINELLRDMGASLIGYTREQDATNARMAEMFEGLQEAANAHVDAIEALIPTPQQAQLAAEFRQHLDDTAAAWDVERLPVAEEYGGIDTAMTDVEQPANDRGEDFPAMTPEAWKAAIKEYREEAAAGERSRQGLPPTEVSKEMDRMKGKDDLEPEI